MTKKPEILSHGQKAKIESDTDIALEISKKAIVEMCARGLIRQLLFTLWEGKS
jgi:hypothetical protein